MRAGGLSAVRFERTRLLDRKPSVDLWEGSVEGRPCLIKRFSKEHNRYWSDFFLQSTIQSPVFLQPNMAGRSGSGMFCYAMPLDFVPQKPDDHTKFESFIIGFLSLIHALQSRHLTFKWDADHLITNGKTGQIFLAGSSSLHQANHHSRSHEISTL